MPTAGLPRAQAQISDQRGYPTREWYAFFSRLLDESTDAGLSAQIQSILDRLKQLEAGSIADLSIIGLNSVSVVGQPSSGRVTITLEGDAEAPGATWYYGTGPDGARGWYQLSDGFDVTTDLTKTVDPTTNVTTFDLADLSNTGVGAALVKITRDAKGRVEGTEAATTDDLPEGTTNRYFPEAPEDGKTYGRKDGDWSEVVKVALSLPIMQATGILAELPLTSDYKVQIRLVNGTDAYVPAVSA